jgi:GNAT superfamily N-acetyltransferase
MNPEIQFQLVSPSDHGVQSLIAQWYLNEWKIPEEKTKERLKQFKASGEQFQVLMTVNNTPVATGGLYHHVGLLDREPRFGVHKHWLALVYTTPENRGKGYGAQICKYIQDHAKALGLRQMFLFTDTAETLYDRLGWKPKERLEMESRNIVVMEKRL